MARSDYFYCAFDYTNPEKCCNFATEIILSVVVTILLSVVYSLLPYRFSLLEGVGGACCQLLTNQVSFCRYFMPLICYTIAVCRKCCDCKLLLARTITERIPSEHRENYGRTTRNHNDKIVRFLNLYNASDLCSATGFSFTIPPHPVRNTGLSQKHTDKPSFGSSCASFWNHWAYFSSMDCLYCYDCEAKWT